MSQSQIDFSSSAGNELRHAALVCISVCDAMKKAADVSAMGEAWQAGQLFLDRDAQLKPLEPIPGRPAKPELISPKMLKHRSMATLEGRAAMIHALTHIEFNAINLALDAIWRFSAMPHDYYRDWLQVAVEEARHFSLLAAHLHTLGYQYGDFAAHDSLWEMCDKTAGDCLARMALVPRTLEARGLDASPCMRGKLEQAGDSAAAAILDLILREEIGHVAIGNRWYNYLCQRQQLDPLHTYAQLLQRHKAPVLHGPFNMEARRAAGFSERELQILAAKIVGAH